MNMHVKPETAAFKVGDRVRYSDHRCEGFGIIRSLTEYGSGAYVAVDPKDSRWAIYSGDGAYCGERSECRYFDFPSLEPTPALRIEAGKHYRTRDGRKVGPMVKWWTYSDVRHPWEADDLEDNGLWRDDGTSEYDPDLVAEWVDEPKKGCAAAEVDNLRDEYGGAVSTPKFKVGDRVVDVDDMQTAAFVREVLPNGKIKIEWELNPGLFGTWSESGFRLAPHATNPAIVCLIENGRPKPARLPKVHGSVDSATAEAERLAAMKPGKEFGVFELVARRIGDVTVRSL